VRELVLPSIERHGSVEAWDHRRHGAFQKGRHSVGVTRQYLRPTGKQDNCQVAVTLSIANHAASLPIAHRLYLPEDWASDRPRRDKAGVPKPISFVTKARDRVRSDPRSLHGRHPPWRSADGCRLWRRPPGCAPS